MSCTPLDLIVNACRFNCLDASQSSAMSAGLLCQIAQQGIPTGYPTDILGEGGEFILGEGGENILEQ